MHTFLVEIDDDLHLQLRAAAAAEDRDIGALVLALLKREAMQAELDHGGEYKRWHRGWEIYSRAPVRYGAVRWPDTVETSHGDPRWLP